MFLKKQTTTIAIIADTGTVPSQTSPRGVNKAEVEEIDKKLGPLMKSSIRFYKSLTSMENRNDMLEK